MKANLKLTACLKLINDQNISLEDVLKLVDDPQKDLDYQIANACGNNNEFWTDLIIREYGNLIILTRKDIASESHDYAKSLVKGVIHYYIKVNIFHNSILELPTICNSELQQKIIDDPDVVGYINFDLRGVKPLPGSVGYLIRFYFDDNGAPTDMTVPQTFICDPTKESINSCFKVLKRYLSENFLDMYNQYVTGVVNGDVNIRNVNFHDTPTLEELDDIFASELVYTAGVFAPDNFGFKECILSAGNGIDIAYLTIFFDFAQLKF